jgi:hypothetical protein
VTWIVPFWFEVEPAGATVIKRCVIDSGGSPQGWLV